MRQPGQFSASLLYLRRDAGSSAFRQLRGLSCWCAQSDRPLSGHLYLRLPCSRCCVKYTGGSSSRVGYHISDCGALVSTTVRCRSSLYSLKPMPFAQQPTANAVSISMAWNAVVSSATSVLEYRSIPRGGSWSDDQRRRLETMLRRNCGNTRRSLCRVQERRECFLVQKHMADSDCAGRDGRPGDDLYRAVGRAFSKSLFDLEPKAAATICSIMIIAWALASPSLGHSHQDRETQSRRI